MLFLHLVMKVINESCDNNDLVTPCDGDTQSQQTQLNNKLNSIEDKVQTVLVAHLK